MKNIKLYTSLLLVLTATTILMTYGNCGKGPYFTAKVESASLFAPSTNNFTAAKMDESLIRGQFVDKCIYSPQGTYKVCIRPEWGDSVTYFGPAHSDANNLAVNTIDDSNIGGLLQAAFYDFPHRWQKCSYDASCANLTSPPCSQIPGGDMNGWNPTQAGGTCGDPSTVESRQVVGNTIESVILTKQWNPLWDQDNCISAISSAARSAICSNPVFLSIFSDIRLHQKIGFYNDQTVQIDYVVENISDMDHGTRDQEAPIAFIPSYLNRVMNKNGDVAQTSEYQFFETPGNWAVVTNNDASYGIGMLIPEDVPGFTMSRYLYNAFRAVRDMTIGPKAKVKITTYVAIGSYDTIKRNFTDLQPEEYPPVSDPSVPVKTFSPFTLNAGQSLQAGIYNLTMQGDGNLVVYQGSSALWAANSYPSLDGQAVTGRSCDSCYASFQGDGNLVLYNSQGTAYWATKTDGNTGAVLAIFSSSPNLKILSSQNAVLFPNSNSSNSGSSSSSDCNPIILAFFPWMCSSASTTPTPTPAPTPTAIPTSTPTPAPTPSATASSSGETKTFSSLTLNAGQSANIGSLNLTMQGDGNFVLYQGSTVLWAASSTASLDGQAVAGRSCGSCYATFQGDGNLVLYNQQTAYWASNTSGNAGATLVINSQSPHLKIVSTSGATLFSSSGGSGTSPACNSIIQMLFPWLCM